MLAAPRREKETEEERENESLRHFINTISSDADRTRTGGRVLGERNYKWNAMREMRPRARRIIPRARARVINISLGTIKKRTRERDDDGINTRRARLCLNVFFLFLRLGLIDLGTVC